MTTLRFIVRGLRHYWKWHLSLVAGVALACAILSGSLVVGDSVRATLRQQAAERLGRIDTVAVGGDRFVTTGLVERAAGELFGAAVAPVVALRGTVANEDGSLRANNVNVYGVDGRFWAMSDAASVPDGWDDEGRTLVLGDALASRLEVGPGESVLVRVEIPSLLSRDAPLSGATDDASTTAAIRAPVAATAGPEHLGRFSLRNEQGRALNVFLPLELIQDRINQSGRANLVLFAASGGGSASAARVTEALDGHWKLEDAALDLKPVTDEGSVDGANEWQLTTARVFLDPEVVDGVEKVLGSDVQGAVTYLVNGIRSATGETPYSMVTAFDQRRNRFFGGRVLERDEAFITRWLADDRGLEEGDSLTIRFYVAGEGRDLRENEATFRVAGILPMDHPEVKRSWTPDFPGVSESENCRDWDPGFNVDLGAIRDKDEDYWDEYKGTPKVFIPLEAGVDLWRNRFGEWTALRFPRPHISADDFGVALRDAIGVDAFGVAVVDVRAQASSAASQSMDFGGLFVSMGFFLVVAALVLAALLFVFSIEKRASQIGLLLAVGLTRRRVRRIFIVEALILSIIGAALGSLLGIGYTRAALWALSGEWSGAVAGARMVYAARPLSLVVGAVATVFLAVAIAMLVTRRIGRAAASGLLAGGFSRDEGARARAIGRPVRILGTLRFWLGAILAGAAIAGMIVGRTAGAALLPAVFFGAGSGLLAAGLFWISAQLAAMASSDRPARGVWQLGVRNAVRRSGRSLAVAGVMAAGVFLVVAVNAFRLSAEQDAADRKSGTGGFALFGESALPIYEDLNTPEGREAFGLEESDVQGVAFVPLRQSEGDDASCLNLNRAQKPIVWGVAPPALASRDAFAFSAIDRSVEPASPEISPWTILGANLEGDAIPAVADQNTAMWALGLKLGDELVLDLGESRQARIRIVGFVANSILQGRVIVSERNFIRLFPGTGGYRAFLIDAGVPDTGELRRLLTRQLQNRGFDVVSAADRLAGFNTVQNTYLTIFSTLGGLGLLLGTLGLGIIVARNVMERRSELGVLQAVGFSRARLRRLVLGEHWFLHVAGLLLGTAAAVAAVWPSIRAPGAGLPIGLLLGMTGGILIGGLVFCWVAAWIALRGPLTDAIRHE